MAQDPNTRSAISAARSEKVSRAVARLIAREIADNQLLPGSALSPELVMAERYGVGRSSIREALRLLETQGLIVMRPGVGGGPIVGRPTPVDFGTTMTLFLQVQGTRFSEVFDSLAPLGGLCGALAAQRCAVEGPERFDREVADTLVPSPSGVMADVEWMDESGGFHVALWRLVGNNVLSLTALAIGSIFADRAKFDRHPQWTARQRRQVHAEHVAIGEAVRAGDVDAARELSEVHYAKIVKAVRRMYPNLDHEVIDWH